MELRAVDGARIADKTVLKMMGEMGLRCGIRRETVYHRYNSYRGAVGEVFGNVLGRDFSADGPWQKMGTDVTEFKCSFGKAYLAPVYDFGSKEIVAWSISESPGLAQQEEMLAMLMSQSRKSGLTKHRRRSSRRPPWPRRPRASASATRPRPACAAPRLSGPPPARRGPWQGPAPRRAP